MNKFDSFVDFCNTNNYIYELYDNEIYIKTDSDNWKIRSSQGKTYHLLHLNKRGKMHWHEQSITTLKDYKVISKIKKHDEYCKYIRGW